MGWKWLENEWGYMPLLRVYYFPIAIAFQKICALQVKPTRPIRTAPGIQAHILILLCLHREGWGAAGKNRPHQGKNEGIN